MHMSRATYMNYTITQKVTVPFVYFKTLIPSPGIHNLYIGGGIIWYYETINYIKYGRNINNINYWK